MSTSSNIPTLTVEDDEDKDTEVQEDYAEDVMDTLWNFDDGEGSFCIFNLYK